MANIRRRIEKLEQVVVPVQPLGEHRLQIRVEDGKRCDAVLQRELDEKGISINEVDTITFIGNLYVQPIRDLRNHPDWDVIQKLNREGRIWTVHVVGSKSEYEEYLRRKEQGLI